MLDEAIRLDPRNETAMLWRAGVAESPEEGIAQLEAVLALNPGNVRAKQGIAHYELQLPPKWLCPLCAASARENPGFACPSCKAVLALDVPSRFSQPTGADATIVKAAAARLYDSFKLTQDANTAYHLGLSYLNLGFRREGIQALQMAARHKSAEPEWKNLVAGIVQFFAEAPVVATPKPEKPLIIAVDDSPTMQKLLSVTLKAAGYEVVVASSGDDALESIRATGAPRLFILDVNMPGMDGFQLCKLFRQTAETAKAPVIFLTGKDGFFNKLRGQWLGAAEYLVKPFDPQKLVAAVQKLVPVKAAHARI